MPGQNSTEVEAQAARFARRLSGALGDRMVGLYLVGSFALGDLQPDSDLDFVAVLADVDRAADEALLGPFHRDVSDRTLEGFYIAGGDLRRHPADSVSPRLHWLNGEWRMVAGALIVESEMLRRFGHRVLGLPVDDLGVSTQALISAPSHSETSRSTGRRGSNEPARGSWITVPCGSRHGPPRGASSAYRGCT